MYKELKNREYKICVVGLGYVGLPLALEFAKYFDVIGFDINKARVELMKKGIDPSEELESKEFENKSIVYTSDIEEIKEAKFYIVGVPTPVDEHAVPDLRPLLSASETIGKVIKKGDYVVYESTVYPGSTEDDCVPLIEKFSGLRFCTDFKVGYSPERINPGDKERPVHKILKIVSGCDKESADEIEKVYAEAITAGIYKASSIKVAEAAKIIENTQRDLNISLMNELSIIFDKIGIDTMEVIEAAATKWNFIKFYPGLVGGHCIGVDPYYLVYKAKQLGYDPQVILSGRRINDGMPAYVAKKLVQTLIQNGKNPKESKVLIMGVTFKENVSDIRNSKIANLAQELIDYSVEVDLVDPYASPQEFYHEYKIKMQTGNDNDYDAVIVAVNHNKYKDLDFGFFKSIMKNNPVLFDLKAIYRYPEDKSLTYWRL
jgi:UDP-N-acetyl-D-glucosamine/UDP-N-acetyl-D-galactosamine dehydrogenase